MMAILFMIVIFATGFEVLYIYGGKQAIGKYCMPVVTTGLVMSCTMLLATKIDMSHMSSLLAAMCGFPVLLIWSRYKYNFSADGRDILPKHLETTAKMSFNTAALPYYLVIGIAVFVQISPIKSALSGIYWGLDYPMTSTALGYTVEAATAYNKIKWFSHPALSLFVAAFIGGTVYILKAGVSHNIFKDAAKNTVKKCIPTSVGICTMVMMALLMSETGMSIMIAEGVASVIGNAYPFVSPFIGMLGSFITNSNTNSNIMFGYLQYETGLILGLNGVLLAAAQSVGGSIGVCISPTTVMMNAANLGMENKESVIIKKNLVFCLINATLVGLAVLFMA